VFCVGCVGGVGVRGESERWLYVDLRVKKKPSH